MIVCTVIVTAVFLQCGVTFETNLTAVTLMLMWSAHHINWWNMITCTHVCMSAHTT